MVQGPNGNGYACVLLRGVFSHSFEFTKRLLIALLETEKVVRQDSLTHLSNRVAFNEGLEGALSRLARSNEQFAVLVLDLDRFKEVNDRLGHPVRGLIAPNDFIGIAEETGLIHSIGE